MRKHRAAEEERGAFLQPREPHVLLSKATPPSGDRVFSLSTRLEQQLPGLGALLRLLRLSGYTCRPPREFTSSRQLVQVGCSLSRQ
ncbi:hypothetical protein MRX96_007084 [Rhipicephalus microplus]